MPETWGLVVPFLDDNPVYAYGVEFGLLYAEMRQKPAVIKNYFLRPNQEQILLLANRMGYLVVSMKPWDNSWFFLHLAKGDSDVCEADGSGLCDGPEEAA
jgi:hypothetical protein